MVRPLVESLLYEGVKVWIDRPGFGDSHFGFSDDFIKAHDIRGIRSGNAFDQAIIQALNESAAVLFCLSRSFSGQRRVLEHEATIAYAQDKLVACIVDDLPYEDIPNDGLLSGNIHYERVSPPRLQLALEHLKPGNSGNRGAAAAKPEQLPADLREAWEVVRKLKRDIEACFDRHSEQVFSEPTKAEWAAALQELASYPVTPVIRPFDIPEALDGLLAERFGEPALAKQLIRQAMSLRKEVNPEGAKDSQILVSLGDLPPVATTPPSEFWSSAVTIAGQKSPRTLAALMITPFAPKFETMPLETEDILGRFAEKLKNP